MLVQDLRHGTRLLARSRGFAIAAVATLALGIGAQAAMFSVVNAVLLRPLPFPEPERLVVLHGRQGHRDTGPFASSLPDFESWRDAGGPFERIATLGHWHFTVTGHGLPERVQGARVSGEFFTALGMRPALGRTLLPEDDRPGAAPVLVLGYRLWRGSFGSDPGVLGRVVTVEDRAHTIVGVMPPEFTFPDEDIELWGALADALTGVPRDARFMMTFARLNPAASLDEAQAFLDTATARLLREHPDTNTGWGWRLVDAHETVVGRVRPVLLLLLGAVGLVLLMTSVNVAGLLVARATRRRRESAIRVALGAGRGQLVGQFVAENLVLALAGGMAGLAFAPAIVAAIRRFGPDDVPRLTQAGVDLRVIVLALSTTIALGFALGAVAALQAVRRDVQDSLKDGTAAGASRARRRLQSALVVGQVALAVVLLVGGGLVLRSFARLLSVPRGFDASGVLTMKVFLGVGRYTTLEAQRRFVRDAIERLGALPGAASVGYASRVPVSDVVSQAKLLVEGRPFTRADAPSAQYVAVSPGYFRALRIALRKGRHFSDADTSASEGVLIINESAAGLLWPGEDPIGRRVRWVPAGDDPPWQRVVGVVADVRGRGLHRDEGPVFYAPYTQRTFPWMRTAAFFIRAPADPLALAGSARRALHAMDPEQPVYDVAALEDVIARSVAPRRFQALVLQSFATLALLLTAVGVYGLMSHAVASRTREIGVRVALGARPRDVVRLVVGDGMRLALLGLAIGMAAAVALRGAIASLLFGVSASDPLTFAVAATVLLAAALAASALPARRAAQLDPTRALARE